MADAIENKEKIIMNRILKRLVWVIIIIPLAYLALVWKKIPDRVATHYNLQGQPDEFGNKSTLWIGIGVIAFVIALIYLLLINVHRIDPKKHAAENKDRLLRMAFTIVVFTTLISIAIVRASLIEGGIKFNIRFVFATMGFMWAILGNYFHNLKPNYFAGLRLPWTLENEDNWRKTHWLAGRLWFAVGLAVGVMWLFIPLTAGIIITFILLAITVIVPLVYSFRLYKKSKTLETSNHK
jgi:immunity protein, SdpI family